MEFLLSEAFKPSYFFKPKSEREVSDLLKRYGSRSRIVAGGTGLYEVAHRGLLSDVEALIDITGLGLEYIRKEEQQVCFGACASMASIFRSRELDGLPELGAVRDALSLIQPLQVKNIATVGGAICTALPFFDLPIALISLDSSVVIAPGNREAKLAEFISGYFSVNLEEGEFVREIRTPILSKRGKGRAGSSFQKFALSGDDWALVNCAAFVQLGDPMKLEASKARLCFGGGVGDRPKRASETERRLEGKSLEDESSIKNILDQTLPRDIETISDIRASAEYRMQIAKVIGRRALSSAAKRALEHYADHVS